jgi:hypothetical protein
LFLIAGVLYYFTETEIKTLLQDFTAAFSRLEMVFDFASPTGVKVVNKKVIDDGGMNKAAYLQWGVENLKILPRWDARIKIVRNMPMFRDYKKQLDLKRRIAASFSDWMKIMSLAHIRVEN